MDDEALNLSIRQFLKQFGVTAQREIERAVREAAAAGTIAGDETLDARATLRLPVVGLDHEVRGEIRLGPSAG